MIDEDSFPLWIPYCCFALHLLFHICSLRVFKTLVGYALRLYLGPPEAKVSDKSHL